MDKIDKIYKVSMGKLHIVPVEKTTSKLVFIRRCSPFGFSRTIDKDHVCVTPAEAIQEAKTRALSKIGMHKDGLKAAEAVLQAIKELELEYTQEAATLGDNEDD